MKFKPNCPVPSTIHVTYAPAKFEIATNGLGEDTIAGNMTDVCQGTDGWAYLKEGHPKVPIMGVINPTTPKIEDLT